jgi:predicted RNase H-like HicB family nuclease
MPNGVAITINAKLLWVIFQDRASRYWIGVCDVLRISVQGKTVAELHENIEDALNSLFKDLLERNELDSFLRQHQLFL